MESTKADVSYREREMPEWLVSNRKVCPHMLCSLVVPVESARLEKGADK